MFGATDRIADGLAEVDGSNYNDDACVPCIRDTRRRVFRPQLTDVKVGRAEVVELALCGPAGAEPTRARASRPCFDLYRVDSQPDH